MRLQTTRTSLRTPGHANVTFRPQWPTAVPGGAVWLISPNIIALAHDPTASITTNAWQSEAAWSSGGGGASSKTTGDSAEPSYQNAANIPDSTRCAGMLILTPIPAPACPSTIPMISAAAACGRGTAAPVSPARAGRGSSPLPTSSAASRTQPVEQQQRRRLFVQYGPLRPLQHVNKPRFERRFPRHHQPVYGNPTLTGYDMATGIGAPIANVLIPLLTSPTWKTPEPESVMLTVISGPGLSEGISTLAMGAPMPVAMS